DVRGVTVEPERREQRAEAPTVVFARAREQLEPRTRWRAEVGACERSRELLPLAVDALERVVQATAPLAECRARVRDQPRDRPDAREGDATTVAAQRIAARGERLVAARTREALDELRGMVHWSTFGSRLKRSRTVFAYRHRVSRPEPVHASRYVKPAKRCKR